VTVKSTKTVAIIGQGYVGLPLAVAAATAGWKVIGVDSLESKVAKINSGSSPVEDVSDYVLRDFLSQNLYEATTDFSRVGEANVIVICVPTPLNDLREPDLKLLINATERIAQFATDETLIVTESTSFPGTLREIIIPIFIKSESQAIRKLYFATAPERVNPGDTTWNQKNTPRLVGAIDKQSEQKAMEFYRSICDVAIGVSTPEIAEAAKLLENTFRLVNIALVNEFTRLCEKSRINVHEVIDAASTKPYGFMPFRPGVGVGGHCIPVDPMYLTWWAKKKGIRADLIELSDLTNRAMPAYVAERIMALSGSSSASPRVLILGVAYKPGVSDVRETPALELRDELVKRGAIVAWHDPLVSDWEGSKCEAITWPCDVAVVATLQPGMEINTLIEADVKVLDCTNSFASDSRVIQL
jgi:UDP-N-acetyl-D-glucosamine dehydrogenase